MFTSFAVFACVASVAGIQGERVDTVETTGQSVNRVVGDSLSASGPRRALVQVAANRETARQMKGIEASDSVAQRRRAIEHSDWYYRRLTIHKAASFATAPLFVAEYIVGQKLFDGNPSSGEKPLTRLSRPGSVCCSG